MFTLQSPHRPELMAETLDRLKLDLVSAYARGANVDIADWVRRYPIYRDEILDFWVWLKGMPRSTESDSEPEGGHHLEPSESYVYGRLLRDSCLAVTFGAEWLKPAVDSEREALSVELEALRQQPPSDRGRAVAFPKAVVCTWIVAQLQTERPRVTRLAVQKVMYVLEEAMRLGIFTEHDRKRLGPYDRTARYKNAEPIAKSKGWLRISGTTFSATDNLSEVSRYVAGYLRSEGIARRLVTQLAPLSDDELETVATVHSIGKELSAAERSMTLDEIKRVLAQSPVWQEKLTRANFTPSKIEEAMRFLQELRLLG
jgi:hypothetical protein